jgi:tetratricopeptide (TPR) repeat protein
MPGEIQRLYTAHRRSRAERFVVLLALAVCLCGCKPQPRIASKTAPTAPTTPTVTDQKLASDLAGARIDVAKTKLEQKRLAEALALLISALKADSTSAEARSLLGTILGQTVWNLPVLTLDHLLPIEQITTDGRTSLWVSLGGRANTTVRWNLETLQIESILFPGNESETHSLAFDPRHQSAVIERDGVTLLCHAQTLKPICDLGSLPPTLTPSAVVVFSPNGLLMAHPGTVSKTAHSIIWQIRDSASGQIIRTSDPVAADAPQPLAATLDRHRLRVLHGDGSSLEIPVSPVEEIKKIPAPAPVKLLQAQFSVDGNSALTLHQEKPRQPPAQSVVSYGSGSEDGSLEGPALARRFSWSRQPNIWTGLLHQLPHRPFWVEGNVVQILTEIHAPIETAAAITAAAFGHGDVITGEENGVLTVHRLLPLPRKILKETQLDGLKPAELTSLENLSQALTGIRYEEQARTFSRLTTRDRAAAFGACDFEKILISFPQLDFAPVVLAFKAATPRTATSAAFQPLRDRLAQADVTAQRTPTAATALALALKSESPESIEAILASAADLPPLLRQISQSRIARLRGHKAKALSVWPEIIPELADVRRCEDWQGWEQADFKPALDEIRHCVSSELAAIEVPEAATPDQRKAVAERLNHPETLDTVGQRRFAAACLKAALAFSTHKEETQVTFQLAALARKMGAPAGPCLRAEALALTALGDYQQAHPRWIELITEQPIETTLPSDYAEAAYTAFENADPQQAMEILTTGMHRFPQDGNFALRAGWVALLTNHPERAYQFLQSGQRLGFPPEKSENATALLTIAAAQSGAQDDAEAYFQDLLEIDPAWANSATLDTLDWPAQLKAVLAEFAH